MLRMHLPIAGIAICSLAPALLPQAGPTPKILFSEDFSGPTLDRSRWSVIVTGRTVNDEQQAYIDSPDVLALRDGMLVIRPRYRPGFTTPDGQSFDFVSGRIDTRQKFEFSYGTAAARMKLVGGSGLWPAFWAIGNGSWPATGEIDIMEHVGEDWISAALHGPGYSGNTPLVKRTPVDVADWHVYSVDWTAESLTFRVDDHEFYRVTKADTKQYGRWAFDEPKHLLVNLALGGGYPRAVNKAGTPYPGLPAPTVEAIKSDTVEILVDWVRVTR